MGDEPTINDQQQPNLSGNDSAKDDSIRVTRLRYCDGDAWWCQRQQSPDNNGLQISTILNRFFYFSFKERISCVSFSFFAHAVEICSK